MIDLSIIIPAYNTERYIKQCLLSLCEQNYDMNKFEIIIVNDDSPDNLESIVIDFAKIYKISSISDKKMEGKGKQEPQVLV